MRTTNEIIAALNQGSTILPALDHYALLNMELANTATKQAHARSRSVRTLLHEEYMRLYGEACALRRAIFMSTLSPEMKAAAANFGI